MAREAQRNEPCEVSTLQREDGRQEGKAHPKDEMSCSPSDGAQDDTKPSARLVLLLPSAASASVSSCSCGRFRFSTPKPRPRHSVANFLSAATSADSPR